MMMSDAEKHAERRKRLEHLLDSYQTSYSREQLQSEQFDKELASIKDQLAKVLNSAPPDRAKTELAAAMRTRNKLERKVGGFEEKLNELDAYNEKLVAMISGLRKQGEPHRQGAKRVQASMDKMSVEMMQLKAACHKALDEREMILLALRRVQDDSARDAADFEAMRHELKLHAEELDSSIKTTEKVLEGKTEHSRRVQYHAMRDARRQRERLEVCYGYLRSQVEGLEKDFGDLQRIVGVPVESTRPNSSQKIIEQFAEKDRRVASLQKYWALQSDEIEEIQLKVAAMERDAATAAAAAADAVALAHGTVSKQHSAAAEEALHAKTLAQFDAVCERFASMFLMCKCDEEPIQGAYLATKGCSTSTILDFMSHLSTAIDEANTLASSLRDVAHTHRSAASRKPNEVVESFLRLRAEAPAGAPEGGDVATRNAEARRQLREELPSVNDLGPEGEGDADDAGRRHGGNSKKGAIDREKRDASIASWVARQQATREGKGSDIREYHEERDPTPTSPSASAR